MRILVLGLTKELPLSPSDALDIADKLVARAASVHSTGQNVILIIVIVVYKSQCLVWNGASHFILYTNMSLR